MVMAKGEADLFFSQGKPLLAAASYLSVSEYRQAIITLIRSNELYLAHFISKIFYPLALKETALLLSEKCEKYFQIEVCLRLLDQDVGDPKKVALQKRRLMNQGFIKPGSIQIEPDSDTKPIEALIVKNKIEDACNAIVEACKADLKTVF